jgi:hypothetical protein
MVQKILYFKNESGDPQKAICLVDIKLTSKQQRDIVIRFVGDDYDKTEDYLYGQFWIEKMDLQHASSLI